MSRLAVLSSVVFTVAWSVGAAEVDIDSMIELKLTLPKDTYFRGGTDPVADLNVSLTLVNKTEKEKLTRDKVEIDQVSRFTAAELAELKNSTPEKQKELLAKKTEKKEIEVDPTNAKSVGFAYAEPRIGSADTVDFIIIKLPDEGETVPEGTPPTIIPRDNLPDQATALDAAPSKYVAAGETSPPYVLPVGNFYLISKPGLYSIRAVMRSIGDRKAVSPFDASKIDKLIQKYPGGFAMSNEEKFRVLPFKMVDRKIDDLKENLQEFERGYPTFDYMLYQVKSDANYDEIYALQRISVRGVDRLEWTRVSTIKTGTMAQMAQVSPKKVALLVTLAKGGAALYNLDFSLPGVVITTKTIPVKEGGEPKLKVEGGNISVE